MLTRPDDDEVKVRLTSPNSNSHVIVGDGLLITLHWKDTVAPSWAVMGDSVEGKLGRPWKER